MQNGTYHVKHKLMITEYKLVAYNGSFKLYSMANKFIKSYSSESVILQHCTILSTIAAIPKKYNVTYWVNGKAREVFNLNASFPVALHKITALKQSGNYNMGLLQPTRAGE